MSAYIVDDAHIDVLVDLADQYQRAIPPRYHGSFRLNFNGLTTNDFTNNELGQMLVDENYKSYNSRYNDEGSDTYRYRRTGKTFSHSQALMTIRGYEYQACEHPDWQKSTAYWFCQALKRLVVAIAVPEQDHDEWAWTDEKLGRAVA